MSKWVVLAEFIAVLAILTLPAVVAGFFNLAFNIQ